MTKFPLWASKLLELTESVLPAVSKRGEGLPLTHINIKAYLSPRHWTLCCCIFACHHVPPSVNPTLQHCYKNNTWVHLLLSSAMLPQTTHFNQYVSCPTREEGTLDFLCASAVDIYSYSPLSSLGRADNNISPCYVPLVKRQPSNHEDCEVTDWQALWDLYGEDIDGLTECITDYTNFYTLFQSRLFTVSQTMTHG